LQLGHGRMPGMNHVTSQCGETLAETEDALVRVEASLRARWHGVRLPR